MHRSLMIVALIAVLLGGVITYATGGTDQVRVSADDVTHDW